MANSTAVSDGSLAGFETALGFNAAVAAVFFALFAVLRPRFPATYAPRSIALGSDKVPVGRGPSSPLLSAPLVSNDELIDKCGHDAFAAVFYVRTMAFLFVALGLPAAVLLLPINITGNNGVSGLNTLSYGNVSNPDKLWAHFFYTVYAVFVTLYVIFQLVAETAKLMQSFQSSKGPQSDFNAIAARTLMVRDVPEEWRNADSLTNVFNRIYPSCVADVIIPKNVPKSLAKLTAKRVQVRNNLEAAISSYFSKLAKFFGSSTDPNDGPENTIVMNGGSQFLVAEQTEREEGLPVQGHLTKPISDASQISAKLRPKHKSPMLIGKSVDSIAEYSKEFRELELKSKKKQLKHGLSDDFIGSANYVSTAFVVFNEPFQTHLASRMTIHDAPAVMGTRIGYIDAKDIVWSNVNLNYFDRQIRSIAAMIIYLLMVIFWGVIVACALTVADLNSLGQNIQLVQDFVNSFPTAAKIIAGVLPSVVVAVLLSLVPPVLRLLSVFSGSPLYSHTEQRVMSQYFGFQLVSVFAVNVVGSSILSSLKQLENDPNSVMDILSSSIPKSANFFIQYLLVLGLSASSTQIAQLAALIVRPIMAALFGKTPRTLFAAKQPPQWFYSTAMAIHGLVVTIGLVYCVIAPIILCFVVIYFLLGTYVYSYMMQYVYVMPRSTGGKFLFAAANHVFVGLYIMEFVVFALFILSKNYVAGGILALLVLMTVWAQSQAKQFISVIETIPVKTIIDLEGAIELPRAAAKSTSPLNKVISLLFPGLTQAVETSSDHSSSISVSMLVPAAMLNADVSLQRMYSNPASGFEPLKVWIPKCGVWGVMETVKTEVIGDGSTVDGARVVFEGAAVNGDGKVVIVDGLADRFTKL
ncbi:hypothetical protein HDU84_001155 [Entophlyctis sp. JEL0112]|nr:hypothetical protein HDU84_001155 [Entophlyctis sp. JEL0112]